MNTQAIAAALRALADAIETPAASVAATPASPTAATAPSAPVQEGQPKPKRGPGRPAKGEEPAAPPTATPVSPPAAPVAAAASSAAVPSGSLTTAIVAKDFTAAAATHGIEFVKGLLKQYAKGATFDTVPQELLPKMQAALRAGPQAAPAQTAQDLLG